MYYVSIVKRFINFKTKYYVHYKCKIYFYRRLTSNFIFVDWM